MERMDPTESTDPTEPTDPVRRMDRGSSKHGPRLDEEMAFETLGVTHGDTAGIGRAEEWREPEPSGEDQPDEGRMPASGDGGEPARDARSLLGTVLHRSVFPADADTLVAAASAGQAPDAVVDELSRLPRGQVFATVSEVWAALGHGFDRRF